MKNNKQKTVLVLGAGGFIGGHLAKRLHEQGHHVRGVDLKYNRFIDLKGIDFIIGDLRDQGVVRTVIDRDFDEVFQLAADMGGAGFVFTGENDADIFHGSGLINFNVANECRKKRVKKIFFSSSACAYSQDFQKEEQVNNLAEHMAWPANPDSVYGVEKLMSEQLYLAYAKNHGLNIRIARFHNVMGEAGSFYDGREKAPAAMCRKAIMASDGDRIEVWGSGKQVRTFLYIDDCLDAVQLLMDSDYKEPINIGSEETVSINELAEISIELSGKNITIKNIVGPTGVAGRSSDNALIKEVLGWEPKVPLKEAMKKLYHWMDGYLKSENAKLIHEMNPDTESVRTFIIDQSYPDKIQRFRLS
ncbi:MAG: NAD-dependent epimerase/dehydratase family protein [Prolixibacteraceae bacterium]|nr:NAD-dependent epimerase/dehydratase family protein [Prolixibacteraceae bacterium]